MAECPHGFSDPQWCADCTPRVESVKPDTPTHPSAIKAQFRGRCVECRDLIEVGDWIVADPRFGWNHDECG